MNEYEPFMKEFKLRSIDLFDFGDNIFKEKRNKIDMERSSSTTVMKRSVCKNVHKDHKHSEK